MSVRTITNLETEVFDHLFELTPRNAVSLGLHEYDGKLPDVSRNRLTEWVSKAKDLQQKVQALDKSVLDCDGRLDTVCLENLIERTIFDIEQLHSYSSRPTVYTVQLSTVPYVSRNYAPVDNRIKALNSHLSNIPTFLKQADLNLDKKLPKPIIEVSIAQTTGVLRDLEGQASAEAKKASPPTRNKYRAVKKTAMDAVNRFIENLKSRSSNSQFAIGKEKFQQILWMNDRLKQPLDEILQLAIDDLEANLEMLWETGEKLAPGKKVDQIVDSIQGNHPSPDKLVPETSEMLEELKRFLIEKQIVSISDKTNCKVVLTPALMGATTTAAMNSPGPFEKPGLEGFYYVTPPEDDWNEKRREERTGWGT